MADLASEMQELLERLGPAPGPGGRVLQFMPAEPGVDAGAIARGFALCAAARSERAVWLLELDLLRSAQHAWFEARQGVFGELGPAARSSPGEATFFTVAPRLGRPGETSDAQLLVAQAVGRRGLWITRFRKEALLPGQGVKILADPAYWDALRVHAEEIVVEAPPLQKSAAGLALAPFVDEIVLVVSARARRAGVVTQLAEDLAAAGGRVAGVVLTDAPDEAPALLRGLLP